MLYYLVGLTLPGKPKCLEIAKPKELQSCSFFFDLENLLFWTSVWCWTDVHLSARGAYIHGSSVLINRLYEWYFLGLFLLLNFSHQFQHPVDVFLKAPCRLNSKLPHPLDNSPAATQLNLIQLLWNDTWFLNIIWWNQISARNDSHYFTSY